MWTATGFTSDLVEIGNGSPFIRGRVCLVHLLKAEAAKGLINSFLRPLGDNVGSNFGGDGESSFLGQEHAPLSSGELGSRSYCSLLA